MEKFLLSITIYKKNSQFQTSENVIISITSEYHRLKVSKNMQILPFVLTGYFHHTYKREKLFLALIKRYLLTSFMCKGYNVLFIFNIFTFIAFFLVTLTACGKLKANHFFSATYKITQLNYLYVNVAFETSCSQPEYIKQVRLQL